MMKRFLSVAAPAAILGLCPIPGPAAADTVREVVQVRVPRDGLDLTLPAHRARFDARVRRAARWACTVRDASVAGERAAARCRDEMVADAAAQLARIAPRG